MPDIVAWMDPGPPEPEPPYNARRVQILYEALTQLPPREFAGWRDRAVWEAHEGEWQAAVGLTVDYLNDQLQSYPRGSEQWNDAAARADELQRLTLGD